MKQSNRFEPLRKNSFALLAIATIVTLASSNNTNAFKYPYTDRSRAITSLILGAIIGGSAGFISAEAENLCIGDKSSGWRLPCWWLERKITLDGTNIFARVTGLTRTATIRDNDTNSNIQITVTDPLLRITTRICSWMVYTYRCLKQKEQHDRRKLIAKLASMTDNPEMKELTVRLLSQ